MSESNQKRVPSNAALSRNPLQIIFKKPNWNGFWLSIVKGGNDECLCGHCQSRIVFLRNKNNGEVIVGSTCVRKKVYWHSGNRATLPAIR